MNGFETPQMTALLFVFVVALASAEPANAVREDTPSGLPVPRFVSLKATKTNCRIGPSFTHPVKVTFLRRGLPVVVIAETKDHWRKIRDVDGDECWAHKSKLSGAETVLVITEGLPLRAVPNETAPMRATLGRHVVARLERTEGEWVRLSTQGVSGWTRPNGLWGAAEHDKFAAPHN